MNQTPKPKITIAAASDSSPSARPLAKRLAEVARGPEREPRERSRVDARRERAERLRRPRSSRGTTLASRAARDTIVSGLASVTDRAEPGRDRDTEAEARRESARRSHPAHP